MDLKFSQLGQPFRVLYKCSSISFGYYTTKTSGYTKFGKINDKSKA
jgi:hypothetical protein